MSEMLPRNRTSAIRQPRRGFTAKKADTIRKRKKPLVNTRISQNQFCRQSSRYSARLIKNVEAMA